MGFAIHWHESAMSVHLFPILNTPHLPPHPILQGYPNAPALSTLSHALNLDWQSVSHMIIYMFQCYSLGSSHHHFLPQSPKDYSIHLCLFCCLYLYKIIYTEIGEKPDNGLGVPISCPWRWIGSKSPLLIHTSFHSDWWTKMMLWDLWFFHLFKFISNNAWKLWSFVFSQYNNSGEKRKVKMLVSHVQLFAIPWTVTTRLLYPWNSPGKNTGVGCHSHLQGIFPTKGLNQGLLHCRQIIYHLGYQVKAT